MNGNLAVKFVIECKDDCELRSLVVSEETWRKMRNNESPPANVEYLGLLSADQLVIAEDDDGIAVVLVKLEEPGREVGGAG